MPKRVGFLLEKILTYENIVLAWEQYNRNRPVAIRREFNEKRARAILAAMRQGEVCFKPPRHKTINEGRKARDLTIPCFDSAIAQTAILNVINPIIDKKLHGRTFSSRKGWGMHRCAKKQERLIRTQPKRSRYALYYDVKKFYAHIRHQDVTNALRRAIKDEGVLNMIAKILAHGSNTDVGLPIGYPGSHVYANLMMVPLYYKIRAVKNVTDCYVYMDNFIVYGRTKKALQRALHASMEWLRGHGLSIKDDWQIFPVDKRPIKTCGLIIYRARMTKLYPRLFRRILRNIDRLQQRLTVKQCLAMAARVGWLKATNRINLMNAHLSWAQIKRRLA